MPPKPKTQPTYATLDDVFAMRAPTTSGMPEKDLELAIAGKDLTIRIRALSRAEALAVRDIEGTAATEQFLLSKALVRPTMTAEQVGRWQAASMGLEMEPIVDEITTLSGLNEKPAMKEAVKAFEDDPDAEFPSLPRAETGDDADPDARGDAQ